MRKGNARIVWALAVSVLGLATIAATYFTQGYMSPASYTQRFVGAVKAGQDERVVAALAPETFTGLLEEAQREARVGDWAKRLIPSDALTEPRVVDGDASTPRVSIGSDGEYVELRRDGLGWKVKSTKYKVRSERTEEYSEPDEYNEDDRVPDGVERTVSEGSTGEKRITEESEIANGVETGKSVVDTEITTPASAKVVLRGTGTSDNPVGVYDILAGTRRVEEFPYVDGVRAAFKKKSNPYIAILISGLGVSGEVYPLLVSPSGAIDDSYGPAKHKGSDTNYAWRWHSSDVPFNEKGDWLIVAVVDGRPAYSITVTVK